MHLAQHLIELEKFKLNSNVHCSLYLSVLIKIICFQQILWDFLGFGNVLVFLGS